MNHPRYLLALLLLGGCGKTPEAWPALAGEYQTGPTVTATPILMYTRNGPVNDPALVDRFLLSRQRQLGPGYFSRTDVPVPANGGLTLTFGANSRATLATAFATRQAELTARTAQYLVLTDLDSSATSTSNSAPYRCATLAEQIRLVNPVQRCSALPPASGYTRSCRFRQVQAVIVRDGALFLPLFSWLVYSSTSTTSCGLGSAGERNLFNPALAGQLLAGDTVVVQTREVALLKK